MSAGGWVEVDGGTRVNMAHVALVAVVPVFEHPGADASSWALRFTMAGGVGGPVGAVVMLSGLSSQKTAELVLAGFVRRSSS